MTDVVFRIPWTPGPGEREEIFEDPYKYFTEKVIDELWYVNIEVDSID